MLLFFLVFLSLLKETVLLLIATTICLGLFTPFDSVLTNLLVFSIWVGPWSSWLVGWLLVCDSASVKNTRVFVCFLNLNGCSVDKFSWADEASYACLLLCVGSWCWNFEAFFWGPRLCSEFLGGYFWKWFCGFFPSCFLALTHSDR